MTGSSSWNDLIFEADVLLLGSFGDAGLVIRSYGEEEGVDAYHGYFAGIRNKDDVFFFGRGDFGWHQFAAQPLPHAINVGQWYHLKFVAVGCYIAASITDDDGHASRVAAHDLRCIPNGRIGLKSYGTGARWRNIHVGPATLATLQAVSQGIAPTMAGVDRTPTETGFTDSALDRYMGPIRLEARRQHFNEATRTISSLSLLNPNSSTPVVLHGVVTLTSPVLYIQDSSGSILVQPLVGGSTVKIGDEVEAKGVVTLRNYTPTLREASIRLLWPNVPISPIAVSVFQLAAGGHHGNFVELEGTYASTSNDIDGKLRLTFYDGAQIFYVLPDTAIGKYFSTLQPGSRMRIRGVATYLSDFTLHHVPFAILLPAPNSLEVIGLPSWWTSIHISLLCLAVLTLALGVHILLIRIQRWRARAVLSERERLAMDMHDTLAQSFAGIGFQLQAVRDDIDASDPLRLHLDLALKMVRSSHDEAKRYISDLRPAYLGTTGLLEAISDYARRIIDRRQIAVHSSAHGRPGPIPLHIADALYRVGQEAVNNSIRHANPAILSVSLAFQSGFVTLTIQDNGTGYSPAVSHVGLGIRGMQKRARDIGAQLDINGSPNTGTTMSITSQILKRKTASERFATFFGFLVGD